MSRLTDDIACFLKSNGFECSHQMRHGFDVICTETPDRRLIKTILPLEISAATLEAAVSHSENVQQAVSMLRSQEGYPLIITEDRWKRQGTMMKARLLAHLEVFSQAYARNCEVRRIDKITAKEFLDRYHSYGNAACKYRYGLYLKRHTGHIAREMGFSGNTDDEGNSLIAVATFSNARKWIKDGREIRSYEWTRYASLPQLRVSGGMGKLLKAFINEVQPDDIMSYADLEWSEGQVYETLGFKGEAAKEPVTFVIDPQTWKRTPYKDGMEGILFFRNSGSRKLRLKLTNYR